MIDFPVNVDDGTMIFKYGSYWKFFYDKKNGSFWKRVLTSEEEAMYAYLRTTINNNYGVNSMAKHAAVLSGLDTGMRSIIEANRQLQRDADIKRIESLSNDGTNFSYNSAWSLGYYSGLQDATEALRGKHI